jgi:hypothetical protein
MEAEPGSMMGRQYVLNGFKANLAKYFAGSTGDSLYDIVSKGVTAAGRENMQDLGPACIITPTDKSMCYFQIGVVSPEFQRGIRGIEVYACAPLAEIKASKHLFRSAPLLFGGEQQNEFVAHILGHPVGYGFRVTRDDTGEPAMMLQMPEATPEHRSALIDLLTTAYPPCEAELAAGMSHNPENMRYLDAFEWAVNRQYFPELTSVRADDNLLYFELMPHTPTGVVCPTLMMKLAVTQPWIGGAVPLRKEAFASIQQLLDMHFGRPDPILWSIQYTTSALGPSSASLIPRSGPSGGTDLRLH